MRVTRVVFAHECVPTGIEHGLAELGHHPQQRFGVVSRLTRIERRVHGDRRPQYSPPNRRPGQTHQIARAAKDSVTRHDQRGRETRGPVGFEELVFWCILLDGADLRSNAAAVCRSRCCKGTFPRVRIEVLSPLALFLRSLVLGDSQSRVRIDESGVGDQARPVDPLGMRGNVQLAPDGDEAALRKHDSSRFNGRSGPSHDRDVGNRCGGFELPMRATHGESKSNKGNQQASVPAIHTFLLHNKP